MMNFVEKVECVQVEKKPQQPGSKNTVNLYILEVTWSDGNKTKVGRPYTEFFDYRNALKEQAVGLKDVSIPDLPGIKHFERGILGKSRESKRKNTIDEFCQDILKLPISFSHSQEVQKFFKPLTISDPVLDVRPESKLNLIPPDLLQALRSQVHTNNKGGMHLGATTRAPSLDGTKPAEKHTPSKPGDSDPHEEVHYKATDDYIKQKDNEVSFNKGAIVDVLQKDLSGWWFVSIEGSEEQGWAPASLLESDNKKHDNSFESQNKDGSSLHRAIHSHTACQPDEISYQKGDLVEVIQYKMDGWWKVRHKDKEGLVPAIHLEPVVQEKGTTKRLASNLYHHNSMYRKSNPPPRQAHLSALYAQVQKPQFKKVQIKKPCPAYAEIAFEADESGSSRPMIIGAENRTEYTEVIPLSLPEHKPKTQSSSPNVKRHNYMNISSAVPRAAYQNITIDSEHGPQLTVDIFEVLEDHNCVSMTNERLQVKRGDFVQGEKVEVTRALCSLVESSGPMSDAKGWIPLEKLKPMYTAVAEVQENLTNYHQQLDLASAPFPAKSNPQAPVFIAKPTPTGAGIQSDKTSNPSPECPTPTCRSVPKPPPLEITVEAEESGEGLPPEPSLPSPSPPGTPSPTKSKEFDDPAKATIIVRAVWSHLGEQDGMLAFKKGDRGRLLCKNNSGWWGVAIGSDRGWVPSAYWEIAEVKPGVPPRSPGLVPSSPFPKSPDGAPAPSSGKLIRHHEAHVNQRWFVGKLSRTDCEVLFKEQAKEMNFVIRESTYRVGDFTLSVQYDGKVRHFPIVRTEDEKYYIGRHSFKNLCHVVNYYQKNPLFYNDSDEAVSLGCPLGMSQC